ncbi:MAG: hypothetical protein WCT54_02820 [Patescibacteria group bacterium]
MKGLIVCGSKDSDEVFVHLYKEFDEVMPGGFPGNHLATPPYHSTFGVIEPIQTGHPCCGLGLERVARANCLPVGRYRVEGWEDDRGNFKLRLTNMANDEKVWCFFGDIDGRCSMDWRGIKAMCADIAAA